MRFFHFQADARGQTCRLLFGFAVVVALWLLLLNVVLAVLWQLALPTLGFPRLFFQVNTWVPLLFVLGGWWLETSGLRDGEALARRLGAREAWPASHTREQRLVHVVTELAIAAGMRVPKVMVLVREPGINAFASGWDEQDAVLAVTQGALDALTREELQGLVAHELSHIREGDTRLNMRLTGMVFGLELIHRMGHSLTERDEQGQMPLWAPLGWVIMAVGWLGWLAGHALQAAVSRQREFLADARAVQWTRNREGLGRVLRKALGLEPSGLAHGGRMHDPLVQHLLLPGHMRQNTRWLDSHPPLVQRIERIYGGRMPPLPLEAVPDAADTGFADTAPLGVG